MKIVWYSLKNQICRCRLTIYRTNLYNLDCDSSWMCYFSKTPQTQNRVKAKPCKKNYGRVSTTIAPCIYGYEMSLLIYGRHNLWCVLIF